MRPWVWMLHHNIDFATRRIVLITSAISAETANFGCGSAVPLFLFNRKFPSGKRGY